MQTLAANSKAATAFSPELWRNVAPCNLPSVRARRAVCPAFLRLPTATHESFGHSCSRWGKMSPRWQSVLCVSVRLSFLPHKRVLLLYKRPESHPRGNVGKTTAGWRGTYGCSLTVCECTFAAHRAAGMHWTCVCSCLYMHKLLLWSKSAAAPKTAAERILQPLQSTNCQRCSAYMLRHASSIQLDGY